MADLSGGGSPIHLMAKPTGAICNLDCAYCYFLDKEALYPGDRFRMSDEILETYIRRLFESQTGPEVTIAWQGGEPTLMGHRFFERAAVLAQRYRRPDQVVRHTIQTNGTLLTDEICEVFVAHDYLVGISIDGPRELHDTYRVDKHGHSTFDDVIRGLELLKAHGVEFNVLCTVNAANQSRALDVYRFFRDDLEVRHIQFIPIVERASRTVTAHFDTVTDRSVDPVEWGNFLVAIFDEWVARDVGRIFVQSFDSALASWLGMEPALCIFAETCGRAVVAEHNGDVYACDHYVEPEYLLGNLTESTLDSLVDSPAQRAFGEAKRDTLPEECLRCPVLFACRGECPKNRFVPTGHDDEAINYLCAGYKTFFTHIDGPMRTMANLLRSGRPASEVMGRL